MNKTVYFMLGLVVAPLWAQAQPAVIPRQPNIPGQAEELQRLSNDVAEVSRQMELVKRDQINYKIEKDLLKEAYSSNLQTINQVITLVLGVFGVIGFLGIRSIKEIQEDHRRELEKIRSLKGNFEDELAKLRNHQLQFDSQVETLAEQNLSQDRRLKALEVIEKVATLVQQRNFFWALQNIEAGLLLSPDDIILLNYKAQCLSALGKPQEAAGVCAHLASLEPADDGYIFNQLEYQAIGGLFEEFDTTYQQQKSNIEARHNGKLSVYLKLLRHGFAGDVSALNAETSAYLKDKMDEPAKPLLENWSFDDVKAGLVALPATRARTLLQAVVGYFAGEMTASALKDALTNEGQLGAAAYEHKPDTTGAA
jgi:hypothetical protein